MCALQQQRAWNNMHGVVPLGMEGGTSLYSCTEATGTRGASMQRRSMTL